MPDATAYRLSLAPDLEPFRPEIEYACDFLDRCHFVERRGDAARVLHYGPGGPPGAVRVPAALFPAGVRLDRDGIHPDRSGLAALEAGRGPAALLPTVASGGGDAARRPSDGALGYDALGLVFFMLSRIEERDFPERDRYGRFPYRASLAARRGVHAAPLADRAARDLAAALTGETKPANRTRYTVRLTHDVDRLRGYHRLHEPVRSALGDVLKRGRPGRALRRLRDAYLGGEPWRSVRYLMDVSERRGLQSRFFFMGPTRLAMDSPYGERMPRLLRAVTDEIAGRGHVVGFHPGFATVADGAEWTRQRRGLEEVIGRPVAEGRQHALGFDAARTPEIWADAGMDIDYTPAFPEASGFRTGTCRGHPAYGLGRRRALGVIQHATAIMDFGLFGGKYRDLGPGAALEECGAIAEVCRGYGGTLVVLYHTGQTRPEHRAFYEALLDRIG